MKKIALTLLLAVALVSPTSAHERGCKDPQKGAPLNCVKHAFNNHDGKFSAMMLPIHAHQLKEFSKASDEMLAFEAVTQAKRGDHVIMMPLYSGITLDAENNVNITYDVKVFTPDGTIYSGADIKDLVSTQQKLIRPDSIPINPYHIFHSRDYAVLRFESKDQLGRYNIQAEIRDNIGKRAVKITADIELTE